MDPVTLTKLQGLGNDFLVLLGDYAGLGLPGGGPDLARRACERHRGIGADGLIWGRRLPGPSGPAAEPQRAGWPGPSGPAAEPQRAGWPGPSGPAAEPQRAGWPGPSLPRNPALAFTLWNADGGEAEMSGNGMRCLAHAALDAGWVAEDRRFGVLTPAGVRHVSIRRLPEPGTTWASVEMGPAKITGEVDRCNVGHGQLLVDVGNPHLVVLGRHPEAVDVATLGPQLSATDPSGLNVEFVALGPGPHEVTMRVWERGVGETEACGTGACAAAVALHHWDRVGANVTVHQPGGDAAVSIDPDGTVTLTGPSTFVARCSLFVPGAA